ncbi:MAG TPA: zinc-binding dehydrogenase, partial [Gaiellaceae bacterium]|nr:zinc-binding dehydrogenase [Gaiellaceae bacterium]
RLAGADVVAVDVVPEKLELARELGAAEAVDAAGEDPVRALRKLGGADRAIVVAATPVAAAQALASLRRGGTLVLVALPQGVLELPIVPTVLKGITVTGSIVGTRAELREVLDLHAAGRTRVITEERPLDAVNEAMADVEAGRVPGRVVLRTG